MKRQLNDSECDSDHRKDNDDNYANDDNGFPVMMSFKRLTINADYPQLPPPLFNPPKAFEADEDTHTQTYHNARCKRSPSPPLAFVEFPIKQRRRHNNFFQELHEPLQSLDTQLTLVREMMAAKHRREILNRLLAARCVNTRSDGIVYDPFDVTQTVAGAPSYLLRSTAGDAYCFRIDSLMRTIARDGPHFSIDTDGRGAQIHVSSDDVFRILAKYEENK